MHPVKPAGRRAGFVRILAGLAACVAAVSALAQPYPAKPIRLVVPFSAGGGGDVTARVIAAQMATRLGQPIVVEPRGGASAIIGTEIVAKSPPDGYTLLMGQTGPNAINPGLFKKLPYDAIRDFAPIALATSYPYVIAINPSSPATSLKEFIALAKSRSGELSFGSAGVGSSAHLAAELFIRTAGLKMTHVPYKGTSQALADVVGGQLHMTFGDVPSTSSMVKSGRLRAIAVTGARRSSILAGIPTAAEAGLEGFEASAWLGFFAPAGTPRPIIDQLNAAVAEALKVPEVRERFARDGVELGGGTPEQFAAFLKQEIQKWGGVIRDAGITAE